MACPAYTAVDVAAFKLHPLGELSNDMIFARNAHTEDEIYFRGPKCTLLKNYAMNNTTRAKLELVFDSENVSYVKFLSQIKSRFIDIMVDSPDEFFRDINKPANELRDILEDILHEPHRHLSSKGILRMTVCCNARSNTRWAKDYCLRATDVHGNDVLLERIHQDTVFAPVVCVRGIRAKNTSNFHIEFLLREIVVTDVATLLPLTRSVDIDEAAVVKDERMDVDVDVDSGRTNQPKTPVTSRAPTQPRTRKVDDPVATEDLEDLDDLPEYDLGLEDDNAAGVVGRNGVAAEGSGQEAFKVKPPRDVYYRWLSEYKSLLRKSRREVLGEWLRSQRIHHAEDVIDEDVVYDSDEDEGYQGYQSN